MQPIHVQPHPLLDAVVFQTTFPKPLAELPSSPALRAGLSLEPAQRFASNDDVRGKIRDLLRHGGYKPTGRGKPASEYLIRAATDGALSSINVAVDACNVASLHSGLPISVVDLDRCRAPLRVDVPPTGSSYVFNRSGQEIDVAGLLCLHDADGPMISDSISPLLSLPMREVEISRIGFRLSGFNPHPSGRAGR